MKKVLLFLGGALLSLGLSATEYNVKVNSVSLSLNAGTGNYETNYEFTDQIDVDALQAGDVITFSMNGQLDQDISSITFGTIVDNSETATPQWWQELGGDWTTSISVTNKVVSGSTSITLTSTPNSGCNKIVVSMQIAGEIAGVEKISFKDADDNYEPKTYNVSISGDYALALNDAKDGYQAVINVTEQMSLSENLNPTDVINIKVEGYVDQAISSITVVVIDGSWNQIVSWGPYTAAVTEGQVSTTVATEVSKGATSSATLSVVLAVQPVIENVSEIKFTKEKGGTTPESPYVDPVLGELQSLWGDGNAVVGKTMTFAASDSGIGFANYDGGFDLSQYKSIIVELEEFPAWATYGQIVVLDVNDETSTFSFDGAVATIDVSKIQANVKQLYLQCGGTGDVTLKEITFSTETPVIPEPAYVDPILGTLSVVWGEGNAVAGKTMIFGESNSGIGFANYDGGFDLSQYESITVELEEFPAWAEYGQIVVMSGVDGKTASMFSFEGTVATVILSELDGNAMQIYLQCGGTGDVTLKEITFNEKGTGTAVEDVAGASFSIEGGMVFSKGTINVYDINGKYLQGADKELNVNDLKSGSYIIKAQEGSIKFVK